MTTSNDRKNLIRYAKSKKFTLKQATDFMKELDKYPTPINKDVNWVNSKTKKSVSIGYC